MRKRLGREYSFLLGELIGEHLTVLKSGSRGLEGLEGRIIDESRNTFLLATSSGRKRVPKASCTFGFPSFRATVKGIWLVGRPEDRTKKLGKDM
ncbi:MAG: ribonuclease P protein subunit [Candidatus Micrarchaeota archaeon]